MMRWFVCLVLSAHMSLVVGACGDDCVRCDDPGDGGQRLAAGVRVAIQNVEQCPRLGGYFAGPGSTLTVASRLLPPQLPMRVDAISYVIDSTDEEPPCDQSLPQTVRVFKSNVVPPPVNPDVHETLLVEGLVDMGTDQTVRRALREPLVLEQGESLYVAVTLEGGETGASCIADCRGGEPGDDDYLAPNASPPFSWSVVTRSDGTPVHFFVDAEGETL